MNNLWHSRWSDQTGVDMSIIAIGGGHNQQTSAS